MSAGDLKLQLGYNTEADHEPTVAFLQEQWRTAFDVNVELVGLEWSSYLTRLNEDPFDIFRLGWGADYPHPNNFLTDLFTCTSGNNNMQYCNEDFDALMADAAVEPDLDTQVRHLQPGAGDAGRRRTGHLHQLGRSLHAGQALGHRPDPDAAGLHQRRVLLHQRHHRRARSRSRSSA